MAFFRGNSDPRDIPEAMNAGVQGVPMNHYETATPQPQANLFDAVELIDGQLAVRKGNDLFAVDDDATDPNAFRFVNAHAGNNNDYYLIANNGEAYPVSPTVFGIVTGLVAPDEAGGDPFQQLFEGQGRTGRRITAQVTLETNADHPDDFKDAALMGLAQLAATGAIAQQSLAARMAVGQHMGAEPYAPTYEEVLRRQQEEDYNRQLAVAAAQQEYTYTPHASEPARGSVEIYHGDDYQQFDLAPTTLSDELLGARPTHSAAVEGTPDFEDVEDPQEDAKATHKKLRKEKAPSSFAARMGKGAVKLALEGLVVTAVAVPGAHTAVHELGSAIPFIQVDKDDSMAFSSDFAHDLKVLALGPKEFVGTVTGLIGKVTP
jgi:hypothetical protein